MADADGEGGGVRGRGGAAGGGIEGGGGGGKVEGEPNTLERGGGGDGLSFVLKPANGGGGFISTCSKEFKNLNTVPSRSLNVRQKVLHPCEPRRWNDRWPRTTSPRYQIHSRR